MDDGLGPAFNGTSCGACHSVPAIGGISPMAEVRAGHRDADGTFRALDAAGNTLFHTFSLPNHVCQPVAAARRQRRRAAHADSAFRRRV